MPHHNFKSFVFISALSLGIPAGISIFTSPLFYSIILVSATLWSSMYHYYDEHNYRSMDEIWANLASLAALGYFILVIGKYGWLSWRTLLPLCFSIISLIIYFSKGDIPEGKQSSDLDNYDMYHGLWHCFSTLTAISLVISPVDHREMLKTLWKLVS